MKHIALENQLKKRITKRRIIEAVLSIVFFIVLIVFVVLYEQSRVVEEIGWGPIKHQNVSYNYNFSWGILIGALGFIPSVIFLIGDFIFAKLATFEVNGESITFYRGLLHNNIYVNGELKDSLTLFGYYLEAPLLDGSKVNVALGKWSVHLTFSNGHPSVDV